MLMAPGAGVVATTRTPDRSKVGPPWTPVAGTAFWSNACRPPPDAPPGAPPAGTGGLWAAPPAQAEASSAAAPSSAHRRARERADGVGEGDAVMCQLLVEQRVDGEAVRSDASTGSGSRCVRRPW